MAEADVGVVENGRRADPRDEVASILAETLLEILVPGAGRLAGTPRNALIHGSQPALVLTENGESKPRSQRGRRRG